MRFGGFCEVIGEKPTAVRALFEKLCDEFFIGEMKGKHRVYGYGDYERWRLFKRLCATGLRQKIAAGIVSRGNGDAERVLAILEGH